MPRMVAMGAVGALLMVGSLAVVAGAASPSAAPAARTVLAEVFLPDGAIPAELEKAGADQMVLVPATAVEVPLANEAIRGRLCVVREGAVDVDSDIGVVDWVAPINGGFASVLRRVPSHHERGGVFMIPALPDAMSDANGSVRYMAGPDGAKLACLHLHQRGGQFPGWPDGVDVTLGVVHSFQADMRRTDGRGTVVRITQLEEPTSGTIGSPTGAVFAMELLESGSLRSSSPGAPAVVGGGKVLTEALYPGVFLTTGDEPTVVLEFAVFPELDPLLTMTSGG